jgi:hypothetical protein
VADYNGRPCSVRNGKCLLSHGSQYHTVNKCPCHGDNSLVSYVYDLESDNARHTSAFLFLPYGNWNEENLHDTMVAFYVGVPILRKVINNCLTLNFR